MREPVPVSAVWAELPKRVEVTFDVPLTAAIGLDVANWYAYRAGWLHTATAVSASGSVVTALMTQSDPSELPDSVTYQPPPYDVLSAAGQPAPAFAQYPIDP